MQRRENWILALLSVGFLPANYYDSDTDNACQKMMLTGDDSFAPRLKHVGRKIGGKECVERVLHEELVSRELDVGANHRDVHCRSLSVT